MVKWTNGVLALSAAVLLCLSACAFPRAPDVHGADPRPDRLPSGTSTCVVTRTITTWSRVDDHSLVVWTGPERGYVIELNERCPGLRDPAGQIHFRSRDGRICDYRSDAVVAGDRRCTIGAIKPR